MPHASNFTGLRNVDFGGKEKLEVFHGKRLDRFSDNLNTVKLCASGFVLGVYSFDRRNFQGGGASEQQQVALLNLAGLANVVNIFTVQRYAEGVGQNLGQLAWGHQHNSATGAFHLDDQVSGAVLTDGRAENIGAVSVFEGVQSFGVFHCGFLFFVADQVPGAGDFGCFAVVKVNSPNGAVGPVVNVVRQRERVLTLRRDDYFACAE